MLVRFIKGFDWFREPKVGSQKWLDTFVEVKRSWVLKTMKRLDKLEKTNEPK